MTATLNEDGWFPVMDDLGETCHVMILPRLTKKEAFDPFVPAYSGFIRLPCGDVYRAWWPCFTDWWE